ncbi:MAG: pyruvate formate lyase-activating protein [Clostridia bacterium]|nr:pyruvate formate lyase-activating protein [Clostridia bacterium]
MIGKIASFQSMGCADGPGVRSVVFLQGCPLHCPYCHNPETQSTEGGEETTVDALIRKILRFFPYFGAEGGVTLSGGEPLLQRDFAEKFLKECKANSLHTALDTSGILHGGAVLDHCDLVLCDLKFTTDALYRQHTGGSLESVLSFMEETAKKEIPLWIRHVVVPELTDEDIDEVIKIAMQFPNLKKIQLLPFRKICTHKYEELGRTFPLAGTPACGKELLEKLNQKIPLNLR